MICRTVWAAVKPAVRHAGHAIARHVGRHAAIHVGLIATTVCVASPIALFALLPPAIASLPHDEAARPADYAPSPVNIPEPSSLLLLALPAAIVALVRGPTR